MFAAVSDGGWNECTYVSRHPPYRGIVQPQPIRYYATHVRQEVEPSCPVSEGGADEFEPDTAGELTDLDNQENVSGPQSMPPNDVSMPNNVPESRSQNNGSIFGML